MGISYPCFSFIFRDLRIPSTFTYTQERGRLHTCPFSFEGIIAQLVLGFRIPFSSLLTSSSVQR